MMIDIFKKVLNKNNVLPFGLVLIGMCIGLGIYGLFPSLPQTTLRIAIIDGDRLKQEAEPFSKEHQLLTQELDKDKPEILRYHTELEKIIESIKSEKNIAKAQKKKTNYEKRKSEIEQIVFQKQQRLLKIEAYLTQLIQETTFEIIKNIAREKNIQLIHNRFVEDKLLIFYNESFLDITSDVIHRLNERLKNLTIPKEILTNDSQ